MACDESDDEMTILGPSGGLDNVTRAFCQHTVFSVEGIMSFLHNMGTAITSALGLSSQS